MIFDGLWIRDVKDQIDNAELEFTIKIGAGASVGIGGIVEAGVEGGIFAKISFNLHDIAAAVPNPNTADGQPKFISQARWKNTFLGIAGPTFPGTTLYLRYPWRIGALPGSLPPRPDSTGLHEYHPLLQDIRTGSGNAARI